MCEDNVLNVHIHDKNGNCVAQHPNTHSAISIWNKHVVGVVAALLFFFVIVIVVVVGGDFHSFLPKSDCIFECMFTF